MSLISHSGSKAHTAVRIAEVGLEHAGLEVVGHEAGRDTAGELAASDVVFQPGLPIHTADSASARSVARAGQVCDSEK